MANAAVVESTGGVCARAAQWTHPSTQRTPRDAARDEQTQQRERTARLFIETS